MDIFVGNLAFNVTEDELKKLFLDYGEVESLNIVKDKYTSESRGFAFVKMPNDEEAQKAVDSLDGSALNGRNIRANKAYPRKDGERKNFKKTDTTIGEAAATKTVGILHNF